MCYDTTCRNLCFYIGKTNKNILFGDLHLKSLTKGHKNYKTEDSLLHIDF